MNDAKAFSSENLGQAPLRPMSACGHVDDIGLDSAPARRSGAKPWLAIAALLSGTLSALEMTNDGMPTASVTTGIMVLGFMGILFGGLSIRNQLFERTASAAVLISVASLMALAGLHIQ